MKKIIIFLLALATMPVFSAEEIDFEKILDSVDFRGSFPDSDYSATFSMITEDPEAGVSKRVVTQFRRDSEDLMLMLTLAPENKKGQGTLKVDNHIWRYDPESRKFTHQTMEDKFEETSARNGDFRRPSISETYNVVDYVSGKLGKYDVWILELEAKDSDAAYPFEKIYIDKSREVMLKQQEFSLSRRLIRTIYSPTFAKIGDKYTPTKRIMVDELLKGKKTTMTITDISVGKLPDNLFTKSYLERVSK